MEENRGTFVPSGDEYQTVESQTAQDLRARYPQTTVFEQQYPDSDGIPRASDHRFGRTTNRYCPIGGWPCRVRPNDSSTIHSDWFLALNSKNKNALTGAGLRHDRYHLPMSGARLVRSAPECIHHLLASHRLGVSEYSRALQAGARPSLLGHLIDHNRSLTHLTLVCPGDLKRK
jgi:hypothetical protein